MLRLEQMTPKKKRITTIAIASAAAIATTILAAIGMMAYPASYETVVNAFATAFDGVSNTFAAVSENVRDAITSAQGLVEQKLM